MNVDRSPYRLIAWLLIPGAGLLGFALWFYFAASNVLIDGRLSGQDQLATLHIELDVLGILLAGLIVIAVVAIPLLIFFVLQKMQQQQAIAILPVLGQMPADQVRQLDGHYASLLLAIQPILQRQVQTIAELNNKNELFADALDEINDIGLQLRRSERRWGLALNATGDGIWEWGAEKNVWYFSPRWKQMLGYQEDELPNLGQTFYQLMHPDDVEVVHQQFTQFIQIRDSAADMLFEAEFRMQHKQGQWLTMLSRAVADRDQEGRILSVVGAQTDVTEQRRATAELSCAKEAAEEAVNQLRGAQLQIIESEKLAALGALVAGVAHEVNTPLGIALTAASTLNSESQQVLSLVEAGHLKKNDLQQYLAIAQEASQLILRHCDNAAALIRSFKNISVDQTSEVIREFDLGLYLDEILQSLKPSLKHTPHQIELACPAGLFVHTYPSAFTQIINNLVQNAMLHAFMPDQRGLIVIQVTQQGTDRVEVRFMDNGVGIAPSVRAKVFEPFYTTKRGQGGSGLGMSIVHNLVVAQLKGMISIEETPGGGASFVIVFPRVL
ncbi:PAS domain-containing sensor histidine kinase [Chitinibacter fontanus]|uniref:histidine kinase n=1 Tax=Chitinibacter fontanus TaxID=1737446 RepID=A0A7D5V8X4_9NEIS|nr:PAS domain-containing sensor histidine kinase [Chitinibacter fontanus]QLI80978.1 PAS domain-containing sensor histidine kinase [Chitinibacter fontanus]